MENFKDLLNLMPKVYDNKNVVKIDTEWEYGDMNYVEGHRYFAPDDFFNNEKLIWSLAYLDRFGTDVEYRHYINYKALFGVVSSDNHLWGYAGDTPAHSLVGLDITYYDEDGKPFDVLFDYFHERWDKMTEEEICEEVNDVLLKNEKYDSTTDD